MCCSDDLWVCSSCEASIISIIYVSDGAAESGVKTSLLFWDRSFKRTPDDGGPSRLESPIFHLSEPIKAERRFAPTRINRRHVWVETMRWLQQTDATGAENTCSLRSPQRWICLCSWEVTEVGRCGDGSGGSPAAQITWGEPVKQTPSQTPLWRPRIEIFFCKSQFFILSPIT